MGLLVSSKKNLRKELYQFYNLFQRIEAERIFPNLIYEARITLISKLDKNLLRKLQTNIYLMNIDAKILNKKLANQIQSI